MARPLYLRYSGLAICIISSFLFMALQGGKVASMIFIMVAIVSIYLLLGRWSGIVYVNGSREISNGATDITAGTALSVHLKFQIPGMWPIPYVVTKDRLVSSYGKQFEFEECFIPDWYRRGEVKYTTPPLRRGFYQFADTECATEDIFGLFRHRGQLRLERSFRVIPKTVSIRSWQQFNHVAKGVYHSATTQSLRETTQINGIRDYVYGDRLSRIHWNATARTGKWKSKEFERESLPKMVVILDACRAAYKNDEQFELAISTAASIIKFGANNALSQGLVITDEQLIFVPPDRQAGHRNVMMNHLIMTEATGNERLGKAIERFWDRLDKQCFVVVISPDYIEMTQAVSHRVMTSETVACLIVLQEQSDSTGDNYGAVGKTPIIYVRTLEQLPQLLGGRTG